MANTTSITGPSSQGGNPFGQISSALAPIYSMFGPSGGGSSGGGTNVLGTNIGGAGGSSSGSNPFGVTTMDPSNPNNVALYSNLANLMGVGGAGLLTGGSNLVNMGTGVTGSGLGVQGAALGMLQQPYDMLSALASGDPGAMTSFAAPQATTLATQMRNAQTQNLQGGPLGGYRAVTAVEQPQALAQTIGQSELGYQQQALQQLMGLGSEVAGIGQNISGTGQQIAGTGTTLTGQGGQFMQNAAADALQKIGLNYQYGGPQTFATIMGPIAQTLGALVGTGGIRGGGCWIAEAIYGPFNMRTRWVRWYLNGPFSDAAFGRLVMRIYMRFGQRIAKQVEKRAWLKRALKPLFNRALDKALAFTTVYG
jgi:hypothetical protein